MKMNMTLHITQDIKAVMKYNNSKMNTKLVISREPKYSDEQIKKIMRETVKDIKSRIKLLEADVHTLNKIRVMLNTDNIECQFEGV